MTIIGDKFRTGQRCDTAGQYVFDGYTDGMTAQAPTNDEPRIVLTADETFPPVRSSSKAAWWKLARTT